MVYSTCDMEYAEQVTAEHKVNEKVGTRVVQRWRLKNSHADNHYLDCEVYSLAAADIMEVRSMHLESANEPAEEKKLPGQEPPTEEENWIRANDNWI